MNIPEPELSIGDERLCIVREKYYGGATKEQFLRWWKTETVPDGAFPVTEVITCKITSRRYDPDEGVWLYKATGTGRYYWDLTVQNKLDYQASENYVEPGGVANEHTRAGISIGRESQLPCQG